MRFARLVTHYWRHAGFLEDGALLRGAGELIGIPGVMVHGRMDISGPPDIAWHLAQAWPDADLVLIGDEGHGLSGDATIDAVVAATDRFRPVQEATAVHGLSPSAQPGGVGAAVPD
jgi:proline iminopeptidase